MKESTHRRLAQQSVKTLTLVAGFLPVVAFAQAVDPAATMAVGDAVANMEAGPGDFGQALINFVTYGSFEAANKSAPSMLGTIAKVMCALALFMMAALSVLGGTNYIIQTANKGVPGGQVISSFWTPIRISVATILLIPFPGGPGFSTLQMGVTEIAQIGNAHGGWLTKEGINHFVHFGAYDPPLIKDTSAVASSLVAAELCMAHVNTSLRKTAVNREYKVIGETHRLTYDYRDTVSRRGMQHVPGYCGGAEITIPKSKEIGAGEAIARSFGKYATFGAVDTIDNKERIAAQHISSNFQGFITSMADQAAVIASKLSSDSQSLADLQDGKSNVDTFVSDNNQANSSGATAGIDLINFKGAFNTGIQSLIAQAVNAAQSSDDDTGWAEEVSSLGWTALGTIYWQQSNDQKIINTIASSVTPAAIMPETSGDFDNDKRWQDLQARFADMIVVEMSAPSIDSDGYGQILSIEDSGGDGEGWYKSVVASISQTVMMAMLTDGNSDFVNKMQSTGNTLTSLADGIVHGAIILRSTSAGLHAASVFGIERVTDAAGGIPVIGKFISAGASIGGAAGIGIATGIASAIEQYTALAKQLILPLILAGFLMAVVLPTIPLFFWLMGVVSWILFYIECLLVSPFWLAAHGTAEKEGWGTEHTRQGYMLMIGLYLNPILRVAGFFAIMVVLYPLGVLIGWLSSYIQGVQAGGYLTSPFLVVGSMLVLAFFAYTVAVRVFSLPNELFERGLRWINGGQEVTGDEGASSRINAMVATFSHKTGNVAFGGKAMPQATPPEGKQTPKKE